MIPSTSKTLFQLRGYCDTKKVINNSNANESHNSHVKNCCCSIYEHLRLNIPDLLGLIMVVVHRRNNYQKRLLFRNQIFQK